MRELTQDGEKDGLLVYRLRHRSGEYRFFEVRWAMYKDEAGAFKQLHLAGRDVTERLRAEQQLEQLTSELRALSLRDELTGLYNRRGFLEVTAQARRAAARDGICSAIIFSDLNGMKRINDEFGHDAGDNALRDVAHVLVAAHASTDVVARLGGDEFVVFCPGFRASQLPLLGLRLRALADAHRAELDRPYRLSISTGVAVAEADSKASLEELLGQADVAMYEQKKARREAGNMTMPPAALKESP